MRALVTMGADIDNKSTGCDLDFIGTEQEHDIHSPRLRHLDRPRTTLTRHKAEIQSTDARSGCMQNGQTVPAVTLRQLGSGRKNGSGIGALQGRLADNNQRILGIFQDFSKITLARGQIDQNLRVIAQIKCIKGPIGRGSQRGDLDATHPPALADAGIEHGGFLARIGPDDQNGIGLLDPDNGGVEHIRTTAPSRIDLRTVLTAINIDRADFGHQLLQGINVFDRSQITGNRTDFC